MTARTLPREPWRGSMICGWQVAYGVPGDTFCAERKGDGLCTCPGHWDELLEDGQDMEFAEGNAYGERHIRIRLLWEPYEGAAPIEATPEEIARYAAILDPVRGEQ